MGTLSKRPQLGSSYQSTRRGGTMSEAFMTSVSSSTQKTLIFVIAGICMMTVSTVLALDHEVDLFKYDEAVDMGSNYMSFENPRPQTIHHNRGTASDFFVAPQTHAHVHHRRSFAVQNAKLCTQSQEGGTHCRHGRCNPETNLCVCYGESKDDGAYLGNWAGDYCTECKYGWAGADCRTECKGGSCNVCSSHGTCNMGTGGDGTCDCWDQFDGVNCTSCTPNYYGADCSLPCPGISQHAAACYGRGTCNDDVGGDGKCTCETGFGGDCLECDAAHFGSECTFKCQGYTEINGDPTPCSGHGFCFNGTAPTANGSCVCDKDWGTPDCGKECPNKCSGHGDCMDGTEGDATCKCHDNWAPPDCSKCTAAKTGANCEISCTPEPATGLICSGHGNCTSENSLSRCACEIGYNGSICLQHCSGDPPCSGHGNCLQSYDNNGQQILSCDCFQDPERGYWAGDSCQYCDLRYNQSERVGCTLKCPVPDENDPNSPVCSGHGECVEGKCFCSVIGNKVWCDTPQQAQKHTGSCAVESFTVGDDGCNLVMCPSAPWTYGGTPGESCQQVGGSTANCQGYNRFTNEVCSGHGFCSNGFWGDGSCTCLPGYAGSGCERACPVNTDTGEICSGLGHGNCISITNPITREVTPTCQCYDKYKGDSCQFTCPTRGGLVCSGNGECSSDGTEAVCKCNKTFTGLACDVPCSCDVENGGCDDNVCKNYLATEACDTCICRGNFTGLCDRCKPGNQGNDCGGLCSLEHGKTVGQVCICDAYWNSASCEVPCPVGETGEVCSGHGGCQGGNLHDGSCSCDPDWYGTSCGVYCTVANCQKPPLNLLNAECHLDTDNLNEDPCKCKDDATGHWTGKNESRCGTCARGYWGPTCTEECECNQHGACDQSTNECQCDADDVRGYWSGTRCEACLDGYIGLNCERRNVAITRLQRNITTDHALQPPEFIRIKNPSAVPRPKLLNIDPVNNVLYAGGTPAFKLGVGDANVDQLEQSMSPELLADTVNVDGIAIYRSGALCDPGEVVFAFVRERETLLLLQSSPICDTPIRLISIPRNALNNSFGGESGVYPQRVSIPELAELNSTIRVVAATEEEGLLPSEKRTYIAFVVAQPVSGRGAPGEYFPSSKLIRIELQPGQNGRATGKAVVVELSDRFPNFIPYDLTIASDRTVEGRIAIGGSNGGEWDVITIDGTGTIDNHLRSASEGVKCWPQLTGGISLTGCTNCRAVEKIRFAPLERPYGINADGTDGNLVTAERSLILSILQEDKTVLVWLQDITSTLKDQVIVAEDNDGKCVTGSIIPNLVRGGGDGGITRVRTPQIQTASGRKDLQPGGWYALMASSNAPDSTTSALTIDFDSKVAYAAYNLTKSQNSLPSYLNKYSLDPLRFGVYGQQQLRFATRSATETVPEVISRLVVDPVGRLLYGLIEGIPSLRIATFLLYEMHTVTPEIADQRGCVQVDGSTNCTMVTITGSGFKEINMPDDDEIPGNEQKYSVLCKFGSDSSFKITNGTILNYNQIVCPATSVDNDTATGSSLGSCDGQDLEVSLYGFRWFTDNQISIKRVQAARIEGNPTPDRASMEGGTRITLKGQSFVDSPSSRCKFNSTNTDIPFNERDATRDPMVLFSEGPNVIYVSPNQVICVLPRAPAASLKTSYVDFANDGQLFSEADPGPAPFQIVGEASGISAALTSPFVQATNISKFAVSVNVVDSEGHALQNIDKNGTTVRILRNVTLESKCNPEVFAWRSEGDPYPYPPCRPIILNSTSFSMEEGEEWELQTQEGVRDFTQLFFYEPRAALVKLSFISPNTDWSSNVSFEIKEGNPYALAISNRNDLIGDGHYFQESGHLVSLEIIVVDQMGNIVQNPGSIEITARIYYVNNFDNATITHARATQTHRADGGNKIRFSELSPAFKHDALHYIEFTSIKPTLIPTTTPPLETEICDNPSSSYKVSGTRRCDPCPPVGAVCNGTEHIQVLKGFWRAPGTKIDIYECDDESACLGSAAPHSCAEGHVGPVCSLCKEGYGKAGTKCTKCPDLSESWLTVIGGGLAFIIGLLVWTVVTLRKDEVTDLSVILRTVVNHMQATGKLGEFSVRWGPQLRTLFSIQSAGSDVSISGLASVECLLKEYDSNYSVVFAGYMGLPLLSLLMAFLVYVTVRGLGLKPVITQKLRDEIYEDIKNMGTSTKTALLLKRYPFYFVFVTTFCVHMFAMYQTFITQSTSVLKCKTIVVGRELEGADEEYKVTLEQHRLLVDMSVNCTSDGDHELRTPALICAIGYGFGVPIVFVFGYKFMNGRINKPELTKLMFMFLIGGYKEKFWFWQAIIMIRKLVLVLVIVFVEENKQLQSYCGMWAMSFALIIQIWFQPNEVKEHNIVEALSLAIITITLNLGLLYFWPDIPAEGETILTILLMLITLVAVAAFAYYMWQPMKETVLGGIQEVAGVIKKMLGNEPEEEDKDEEILSGGKNAKKKNKRLQITDPMRDFDDDDDTRDVEQWGSVQHHSVNTTATFGKARRAIEPSQSKFEEVELGMDDDNGDDKMDVGQMEFGRNGRQFGLARYGQSNLTAPPVPRRDGASRSAFDVGDDDL